ncbi:MAG: hypothetical protein QW566_00115 [Candidatus Jordarchaeales archaeon]
MFVIVTPPFFRIQVYYWLGSMFLSVAVNMPFTVEGERNSFNCDLDVLGCDVCRVV